MENMNTLEVYTVLKKAKFSELQSKELANLLGKYYETEPASKHDLHETEGRMKLELKNTELRLQKEIEQIRLETQGVRLEIQDVRLEIQDVRLEIQTVKADLVRWMIGTVFGAAGLLGVFLKYVK